jgi:hypothetical protein
MCPLRQAIDSGRDRSHHLFLTTSSLLKEVAQVWRDRKLSTLVGEVEEERATQLLALDDDPVAMLDQV